MSAPRKPLLALRRRSGWEAADSGILLWKDARGYLLVFFVLPLGLCAVCLRLIPALPRYWSYLILWWLKPLFDRSILHVLGVRFFEPRSGFSRLIKNLGGSLRRGLAGDLLWRRFNPWRGALLPLRILERLSGRAYKQRRAALIPGGIKFCALLTNLCLILEFILLAGEIGFILMLTELMRPDMIHSISDNLLFLEPMVFAAYCFNLALTEGLYVSMGFGLYINSRVETEGWDLQLLFQSFARKQSPVSVRKQGMSLMALPATLSVMLPAALVLVLMVPVAGYAQTEEPGGPRVSAAESALSPDLDTLEALDEILASPEFGGKRDSWGIRLKNPENPEELPDLETPLGSWAKKFRDLSAYALRLILMLAIAGLGIFSLVRFYRTRKTSVDTAAGSRIMVRAAAPLPADPEPAALLEQARDLHDRGAVRDAWAVCLAAVIAAYTRCRGLSFPPDATEYDCLSRVRAGGVPGEGFADLLSRWIHLAYRGTAPEEGDFEQALAFCQSLLIPRVPAGETPESAGGTR
jgi:hypothetical protein